MCDHSCATCRPRTPPPPWTIILRTADGAEHSPRAIPDSDPPARYNLPIHTGNLASLRETAELPRAGVSILIREFELVNRDPRTRIAHYRERLSTPKYSVCESKAGWWCYACNTTHRSVAPRIVPGR